MVGKTKAFLSIGAIAFILIAIFIPHWKDKLFQTEMKSILDGLLLQERRYRVNKQSKVAVGFGSCWDIVTNGLRLMELANISAPGDPVHHDTISSRPQLAQAFAYFFQNGAAGE